MKKKQINIFILKFVWHMLIQMNLGEFLPKTISYEEYVAVTRQIVMLSDLLEVQ